mgnify:CR=1 FL=1
MAKVKITLVPDPTFPAKVEIPVPGGNAGDVEFKFKTRSRDEFDAFVSGLEGRKDLDVIMDIASGWDMPDEFNEKTVAALCQKYLSAPKAIIDKYFAELTGVRLGN